MDDPKLPAKILRVHAPHLPDLVQDMDLIDAFLADKTGETLKTYGKSLDDFARFLGVTSRKEGLDTLLSAGHRMANRIVHAYRAGMIGRKLAPKTINVRLSALRSAVTLARTLGYVEWHLDVPSMKSIRYKDVRGPGQAGWDKMLAASEAEGSTPMARRDRAILRLLRDRALRRAEVVGLDLEDVDLDGSAVSINGKGRTEKERLTIGDATLAGVADWIAARGTLPGPLFTRLDPGGQFLNARLSGDAVRIIVARIAELAAVGRPVRPHGLRHEAITNALDAGYSMRDVRQFSRHADLNTLAIYDDRRTDIGGEIAKRLGRSGLIPKNTRD